MSRRFLSPLLFASAGQPLPGPTRGCPDSGRGRSSSSVQTPLVRVRALDARRALLTSAAARDVPTRASTPPFFSADALLRAPLRCCVIPLGLGTRS